MDVKMFKNRFKCLQMNASLKTSICHADDASGEA